MVEYFYVKFGGPRSRGFLDIVRINRQTDRQTDRQNNANENAQLSSAWIKICVRKLIYWH